MSTSKTQERRQHARRTRIRHVSTERGGCATPGRDNRITESAIKENREAKPETKEVIQDKRKTTRRKYKTNENKTRKENTENDKERKHKEKEKTKSAK